MAVFRLVWGPGRLLTGIQPPSGEGKLKPGSVPEHPGPAWSWMGAELPPAPPHGGRGLSRHPARPIQALRMRLASPDAVLPGAPPSSHQPTPFEPVSASAEWDCET